jgi:hypothetical protein
MEMRVPMHLHARYAGSEDAIRVLDAPPFGPGFDATVAGLADTLEVWVTSLRDLADVTVWKLLRDSQVVAMAQVGGL